jgi:D-glycero-alpha-D-manno-heptose-7-phosphate kinase
MRSSAGSRRTLNRLPELAQLCDLAGEAASGLRDGDVDAVGVAMNKTSEVEGTLASGVTNSQIDEAVERALAAGATGAKVTGAGGGGFPLIVFPLERQRAVRNAVSDMRELPIKIDPSGWQVVFNVHRDIWS